MSPESVVFLLAVVMTGLSAGLLFGYPVSVNPGLAGVDDRSSLASVQGIDIASQNPLFFIAYLSPLFLLPAVACLYSSSAGWWLATATVVYALGVVGVAVAGDVPLNNRLAAVDLANAPALRAARTEYFGPWNHLHLTRKTAALLAPLPTTVAAL